MEMIILILYIAFKAENIVLKSFESHLGYKKKRPLGILFLILVIYVIKTLIVRDIYSGREERALEYLRFMSIFFVYALILQRVQSAWILVFCSLPLASYLGILLKDSLALRGYALFFHHVQGDID